MNRARPRLFQTYSELDELMILLEKATPYEELDVLRDIRIKAQQVAAIAVADVQYVKQQSEGSD